MISLVSVVQDQLSTSRLGFKLGKSTTPFSFPCQIDKSRPWLLSISTSFNSGKVSFSLSILLNSSKIVYETRSELSNVNREDEELCYLTVERI